jgi:hypothetical protein
MYKLNTPQESLKGAVGISFEIKASQQDESKGYSDSRIMLKLKNTSKRTLSIPYSKPTSQWAQKKVSFKDLPDGVQLTDIVALGIGMNPQSSILDFEIRNLNILYTK